jgi:CubicO group peptidase (beta-lactamase class C family)
MEAFVKGGQVAGVVTLVGHRGRIAQHAAVGLADREANQPMQKDSLFGIASMTKPITAVAVMILRDEGKLALDDPVQRFLPEFENVRLKNAPPSRPMTIRDLMTHTAGLGGSQQNQGTLAQTVAAIAKRPLLFEPGSQWSYSPGLSVCGRIVEIASGQPFDKFLHERIFRPLGMVDTAFVPNAAQRQRLVRLYQPNADKLSLMPTTHWITELAPDRTPNPSGGLFSTAADLFRFYQMVLNGGELAGKRILGADSVKEMTGIQTGDLKTGFTPGNGWGLGWCVVRHPQGVTAMLSPGTFGHGGAFGTQGWVDPKRQIIYVLLIQRTNFGNSDGSDIRQVFQELAAAALPK